jgi:hypothetical protein
MSASLETVRRLTAWAAGSAIPRGDVINLHIADDEDLFVVAFLRMGGESRPWGVAYGTIADGPTVLTVPEGRNRQLVGDMMATFATAILSHFRHPSYSEDGPQGYSTDSLRQLWLPGTSHLEMLHFIAAAYARSTWDRSDIKTLNALGNLANCLFIESQRPGQQTIVSAPDALRQSFSFPATPARQGHLGYLLAWLHEDGTRDTRLAAAQAAEKRTVSTVLDPHIERTVLQPLVTHWGDARNANDSSAMQKVSDQIHTSLSKELLSRWHLAREAAEVVQTDSREFNVGLTSLSADSAKQFYNNWGEKATNEAAELPPYWPNIFTDYGARSAGYAYQIRAAHDQKSRYFLVHGDRELQREELAAGHGIICTVKVVATDAPMWKVDFSYPDLPSLKPGDKLVIAGTPLVVLEVHDIDFESHTVMLRPTWKNAKPKAGAFGMAPNSKDWRGKVLVLIDQMPYSIDERRAAMTRRKKTSGSDITDLIVVQSRRHAALDDDGPVVTSGDDQ